MELPEERIIRLKKLFKKEKVVKIEEIFKHFDVSNITIRRDLARLAKEGYIQKVHGGAIYNDPKDSNIIKSLPIFNEQVKLHPEEKDKIAREASERIEDNNSIIIESGSTCLNIVKYLENKKNIKVSTVGISIAFELWKLSQTRKDIQVGIAGGMISSGSNIFTGIHATNYFDMINADISFIGCTAVSVDKGISTVSMDDSLLTKSVIRSSKKIILLADSSKFEKYSFINVAPLKELNEIITDNKIDLAVVKIIEETGTKITIV